MEVRRRLEEEEAIAFFFATAAFTTFFAPMALIRRTDSPWTSCPCAVLPSRTGLPELARRRTRPLPVAGGSTA